MKLGVKISVFMVALALLATVVTALWAVGAVRKSFHFYVERNMNYRLQRIQAELADYYREKGSWSGVQSLFEGTQPGRGLGFGYGRFGFGGAAGGQRMMGPGPRGPMGGPGTGDVLLADGTGTVIAGSDLSFLGKTDVRLSLKDGLAVEVDGKKIGTLYLVNTFYGEWEREFLNSVTKAAAWAGIAAVLLALFLGVLISGHLTGPLRDLTAAARRLSERDLSFRVRVRTRDEIGELAASFNQMAENMERNEKLRRNLVADTAHELRTPLAILRGNLESLQEGVVQPSAEVIMSLHDEVVRISRLVNELQDVSLAEAGELRLNRLPVEAGELVERVMVPLSGEAQARGIRLQVNIAGNLPQIWVDPDRIVQVLLNLLGNALRYTPEGGEIELSVRQEGEEVLFTVRDTGVGIEPGELNNIFERFYRTGQSRSRSGGGAGLGLAIARSLVEAHGGTIRAESTRGEGSTFTFSIPLRKEKAASSR
ncbi:MAG: HAMP domain-containing protein [Firmicutes bacterium]|nr:HAMP domain-containing protein [Bacillota bacterium]